MSYRTPWLREIWKHVRQLARQVYAPHYMSKDIFSIQVFCDASLPHLLGVPGPTWILQYANGRLRRARRKRKERGSVVTSSTVTVLEVTRFLFFDQFALHVLPSVPTALIGSDPSRLAGLVPTRSQ